MRLALLSLICCSVLSAQNALPPILVQDIFKILSAAPDAAQKQVVHDQVLRLFGRSNLIKGRPGPKIEATTVAWALLDMRPARVLRADGTLLGEMMRLGDDGLQVLVLKLPNFTEFRYRIEVDAIARMAGTVHIEHYDYIADSCRQPGVPVGRLEKFAWNESKTFPGTQRDVTIYLPQQYQSSNEACLMVWQDGSRHADPAGSMRASVVFDNLIHKKEMPVTVGIFIDPGRKSGQKPGDKPANRSFEYDSLGDAYSRFLLGEIIPEVEKRYAVKFRQQPEAWAIAGGSSGGICAFTTAWERPDKFGKVLSWVGSFVDIKGGNDYPSLVRITERKPIRVYLLDGTNDLDNKYGNWPTANRMMEASLKYMGYDFRMDWTECFHGSKGMAPHLPEALRWLWRDVR